jgi:hypothetical protein
VSKANLLAMVCVLSFVAGAAILLTGTDGAGLPIVAIALGMGGVSLAGAVLLRRREPTPPTEGAALLQPAAAPSRAGTIAAVAGAVLGGVALLLTLFVGQGEARSHGFFHLIFGIVVLGLFVAVDRWWKPRAGTSASSMRTPLLVLLWVALAAAFLESIGAAGYDRFNSEHRIEWLTTVHNSATAFGALALLMIPIGIAVLASVFVGRLRARTTTST